jgi:hypothetical protein
VSERCERCKKGYAGTLPRDDLEWPNGKPDSWRPGVREIRVARCTRCSSWLFDLWSTDAERPGVETHDVCVVSHDLARSAALEHDVVSLANVSSQLRRRHLELLVAALPMSSRTALEGIEQGSTPATEAMRGLVTRALALANDGPAIGDVRPRALLGRGGASAVGVRVPLDLGDGSRAVLEVLRERLTLTRMRGDATSRRRRACAGE